MKQIIRNGAGSYLITGRLFTGTKQTASVFTDEDELNDALDALDALGISGIVEELPEVASVNTSEALKQIDSLTAQIVTLRATVAKLGKAKAMPTADQQYRIDHQTFSFAIRFIRAKKLTEVKGVGGWKPSPGLSVVSERTFGTEAEATAHAERFQKIEGHQGFEVYKDTSRRVNAWVNAATGKTNPVIGLKRTNR